MKNQKIERKILWQKGQIVILTSAALLILLILGAYFLTFVLTESRISKSQIEAAQTYYLAEAGINEGIWKLKNDTTWRDGFETPPGCYTFTANFSRSNILFSNGSYQVAIQNTDCGRGQITSTATFTLSRGGPAQRIVKTKVFKALGSLTGEGAVFSGGSSENIDIDSSVVNIYDGNLFSNHNTDIKSFSTVSIYDNPSTEKLEGKLLSNGNITISWSSTLNATAQCGKNICQGDCAEEGCPPVNISMPSVDFDSDDPDSYKQKAISAQNADKCQVLCNGIQCSTKCLFTSSEFEDLLWQIGVQGTLTLNNEITYVTGSIELKGGRSVIVNGALISDGTINVGEKYCWLKGWQGGCGYSQITVNDLGIGKPSGLLTKGKINFGLYSSFQDIEITGLVYANDEARIVSLPWSFTVRGGILARKVSLNSLWSVFNIYLDNSIILEGIWAGSRPPEGTRPSFSPVVTIEHWEEAY